MNNQYYLDEKIKNWLLKGDPSIIFLTNKYLLNASSDKLLSFQKKAERSGWIKKLLDLQRNDYTWGNGLYSPKWISTHYTLLLLTRLEVNPKNNKCKNSARLLLEKGYFKRDKCINFSKSNRGSDVCVTAMILMMLSYFNIKDQRMERFIDYFIENQFKDGGWNCRLMDNHS